MSTLRTLAGRTAAAGAVALVLPLLAAAPALAGGAGGQNRAEKAGSAQASDEDRAGEKQPDPTDPSGAGDNPDGAFQGKGSSTPDQDGTGRDRGLDNNDKTGPGTDGNNGCGNEPREAAPRDGGRPTEDDNNGWCGGKPKPVKATAPAQPGQAPAAGGLPGGGAGEGSVVSRVPATSGPTEGSTGDATDATDGVAPDGVPTAAVLAGLATRSVTNAAPLPGLTVAAGSVAAGVGSGAGVGAGTAASVPPLSLPFTGGPVALLALIGSAALACGGGLLLAVRRRG